MACCAGEERRGATIAPRRGRTVLVVDDDPGVRETTALALELEGYTTIQAEDGLDALLALKTGTLPDVIVLDLEMPIMPGWEFRAAQLEDPALARIPVVICSSAARVVEADRRLPKPFELDALLGAIHELTGG